MSSTNRAQWVKQWVPAWVIPLMILMAIGTVWLRLTIVGTSYSISQADRQIANLKHEQEQAELRLTGLKSPRRLEALAKTKFNLVQPKSDQVVHLK